jgi:hypothetical protein
MNEERYTDNDERNELQATQFVPDDTTDDRYYIEPEVFDYSYNVGLVFQYFVAWTMVHANSEDEAIDFALEQVLLNDGFDFSKYRDIDVELIE